VRKFYKIKEGSFHRKRIRLMYQRIAGLQVCHENQGFWWKKIKHDILLTINLKIEVKRMPQQLFKWKHFESEIIMLCVRWYLKYPLSYRMLVEMIEERGLKITHTTIMRWVTNILPSWMKE